MDFKHLKLCKAVLNKFVVKSSKKKKKSKKKPVLTKKSRSKSVSKK